MTEHISEEVMISPATLRVVTGAFEQIGNIWHLWIYWRPASTPASATFDVGTSPMGGGGALLLCPCHLAGTRNRLPQQSKVGRARRSPLLALRVTSARDSTCDENIYSLRYTKKNLLHQTGSPDAQSGAGALLVRLLAEVREKTLDKALETFSSTDERCWTGTMASSELMDLLPFPLSLSSSSGEANRECKRDKQKGPLLSSVFFLQGGEKEDTPRVLCSPALVASSLCPTSICPQARRELHCSPPPRPQASLHCKPGREPASQDPIQPSEKVWQNHTHTQQRHWKDNRPKLASPPGMQEDA